MSESRVARWRQRLREEGLKALTVWLTTDEELQLKALAAQWHTSPSAIVQHALAQFHPGTPPRLSDNTDTAQYQHSSSHDTLQTQAWLQAELPGMVRGIVEQLAEEIFNRSSDGTDRDQTRFSDVPELPAPRRKNALPMAILRAIAMERQQHPTLTHRAFAGHLFERGVYRSTGRDGVPVPPSTSLIHRWLKEAQAAGLLGGG